MKLFKKIDILAIIKKATSRIKFEMSVIWLVAKHPGIKWPLRIYLLLIIAYVLSPIDLIPDFIPVIGYLDDAILVPILIFIAFKFIPAEIALECRNKATEQKVQLKKKAGYALLIVTIWLTLLIATITLGIYAYKN